MRIVLHCGCYKTATSTTQTIFQRNRKTLLAQHGILYPQSGLKQNLDVDSTESRCHHALYHALKMSAAGQGEAPDAKLAAFRTKLTAEIAEHKPRVVFLSTELLTNTDETVKRKALDLLHSFTDDVVVTMAVRRPDDLIDSMNNQRLKTLRTPAEAKTVDRLYQDAKLWRSILPEGAFRLHYFSKDDFAGFLDRLIEPTGIQFSDPSLDTRVHDNSALTLVGHTLRRMIFEQVINRGQPIDRKLRMRLYRDLQTLEERLTPTPKVVTLTRARRAAIIARCAETWREMATWMGPEDRANLEREFDAFDAKMCPKRNVGTLLALSAEELRTICQAFNAQKFAKLLRPAESAQIPGE